MLEIGSLIDGKYKILSRVGHGGMSEVYLAINEKANKPWAVKEVRKDGVLDFAMVRQSLIAEMDILKKLRHPNLPAIADVIDTDESFIIIMDYVEGHTLAQALEEYGALPQESVLDWARQLCDVLAYLHSRKPPIIYRDMKPANVMLQPDGRVMLVDFGTAREFKEANSADTTCLGTIGYAAPEQYGGMGQTDARTDIYGLGATMYHLVTGQDPGKPPYEFLPIRQINPGLSGGLERIIQKCIQRDPKDRFQSAEELMYALEHVEEMDDRFRRKQKRTLRLFLLPVILCVVSLAISAAGRAGARRVRSETYEYLVAHAGSAEDYCAAILAEPARTEGWLGTQSAPGLIPYLLSDGVLSADEAAVFSRLRAGLDQTASDGYSETVDVLERLRESNREGYDAVCRGVGEAFLFYYDIGVDADRYAAASVWFGNIAQTDPAARLYCDISDCLQSIGRYRRSGQSARLAEEYRQLWERTGDLLAQTDTFAEDAEGLDLKLRVWTEIVRMIDGNAPEFCTAVGADAVQARLTGIDTQSRALSGPFLEEQAAELQRQIKIAAEKAGTAAEIEKTDAE